MAEIIATISDALEISGGHSSLPGNKCIKKSEVSQTGCSLSNSTSYSDNQLVKKKDLYYTPPIVTYKLLFQSECQFKGDMESVNKVDARMNIDTQSPLGWELTPLQSAYYGKSRIHENQGTVEGIFKLDIFTKTNTPLWFWSLTIDKIDDYSVNIKNFRFTGANGIYENFGSIQIDIQTLLDSLGSGVGKMTFDVESPIINYSYSLDVSIMKHNI